MYMYIVHALYIHCACIIYACTCMYVYYKQYTLTRISSEVSSALKPPVRFLYLLGSTSSTHTGQSLTPSSLSSGHSATHTWTVTHAHPHMYCIHTIRCLRGAPENHLAPPELFILVVTYVPLYFLNYWFAPLKSISKKTLTMYQCTCTCIHVYTQAVYIIVEGQTQWMYYVDECVVQKEGMSIVEGKTHSGCIIKL